MKDKITIMCYEYEKFNYLEFSDDSIIRSLSCCVTQNEMNDIRKILDGNKSFAILNLKSENVAVQTIAKWTMKNQVHFELRNVVVTNRV